MLTTGWGDREPIGTGRAHHAGSHERREGYGLFRRRSALFAIGRGVGISDQDVDRGGRGGAR